jgi:hypothetical protein
METKFRTEMVIIAVIRGQLPLSALERVGIRFLDADDNFSSERRFSVEAESVVSVSPNPADIASGLLVYKDDPAQLRRWASFVLSASEIVDLESMERWPEAEELLSGLWDASFDGSVSEDAVRIATRLAR